MPKPKASESWRRKNVATLSELLAVITVLGQGCPGLPGLLTVLSKTENKQTNKKPVTTHT